MKNKIEKYFMRLYETVDEETLNKTSKQLFTDLGWSIENEGSLTKRLYYFKDVVPQHARPYKAFIEFHEDGNTFFAYRLCKDSNDMLPLRLDKLTLEAINKWFEEQEEEVAEGNYI